MDSNRYNRSWRYCGKCEHISRERDPIKRRRGSMVDRLLEVERVEPDRHQCYTALDLHRGPDSEEYDQLDDLDHVWQKNDTS